MAEFLDLFFWSIPIIASTLLTLFLSYLTLKDKNKGKMMFSIAFGLASIGYLMWLLYHAGILQSFRSSFRWFFIPLALAIHIAALSSVSSRDRMNKSFNAFLAASAITTSLAFITLPIMEQIFLVVFSLISIGSVSILGFQVARKRRTYDLIFFIAFGSIICGTLTPELMIDEKFTVLLSLFAIVQLGLAFRITENIEGSGVASFMSMKRLLEKAEENLRVTKEKARVDLLASEERYENVCEEAGFLIIRADRRGKIIYINKRVESYGLKRDNVIGKNMAKFVPRKYWGKLLGELRKVNSGNVSEGEIEIITPSGVLTVDYRSVPFLSEGKIIGGITCIYDITKRSDLEDKLKHYNEELEKEVQDRTKELTKSRKEIENYSRHLEELVEEKTKKLQQSQRLATIGELATMVGHDLRNPLQGIAGAIYCLKKLANQKLNEKEKEMLEIIESAIRFSDKIVNDLLDYSKEVRLNLVETNIKTLVKETLALVKAPLQVRIVDDTMTEHPIRLDKQSMQRVFLNLITNAFEAMPKGGKLTIKSIAKDNNIEVTFEDTGTGICEETMQKLWKPLFTTKAKGMGFGLPICKRIIEAHGGTISAESRPGESTTFTMTLPLSTGNSVSQLDFFFEEPSYEKAKAINQLFRV